MANVLVFGHQNPDNDAIMSAVVLSQLLNQVEYAGNTYEAWSWIWTEVLRFMEKRLV